MRSASLAFLVLVSLASSSFAGVDDHRVVTNLIGVAEIMRQTPRRKGLISKQVWRPAAVGDKLGPGDEVRTGKAGHVWLQVGDEVWHPSMRPSDEEIYYDELMPLSAIRLNSQYKKGPLVTVLKGKVVSHTIKGTIPAAKYWGPKIYPPKVSPRGGQRNPTG